MQIGNPQQNDFQPAVEVRDEHGKPSSLPTARRLIPMPGPLPYFVPLLPGQSRTWHRHVVLSGPQFVASQTFGSLHAQKSLTTPPIRVTLTPSSPLVIRLVRHPLGPSAVVQGPSNGHLYYLASDMCTSNGATSVHTNFYWLRAGSTRINSECTSPSEWHVIAGYPGRPVGTLDYTPSTS